MPVYFTRLFVIKTEKSGIKPLFSLWFFRFVLSDAFQGPDVIFLGR
jgi:hypothetical protein